MYPGVFLMRRRDLVDRARRRPLARHRHAPQGRARERGAARALRAVGRALAGRPAAAASSSRPSFVSWLAEHPLHPCFEYRAGTLVVYLDRRLEDAGHLGWLLDATAEIAPAAAARGRAGRRRARTRLSPAGTLSGVEAVAAQREKEVAGLAHVATVSFLASRAIPSIGFWVALARRRGARARRRAPGPALGLRGEHRRDAANGRADRPGTVHSAAHAGAHRAAARGARGARRDGRAGRCWCAARSASSRTPSPARS